MFRNHSMRGRSLAFTLIFSLGLAIAAGPVWATSLVLEGTANLLDRSDSVVTGTVTEVEARMHPEHQFIYTYVTLQVTEVLKGTATSVGQTITLQELGGTVDKWTHYVSAVPQYEVGETVLSFLENRDDDLFRTFGMIQGKFRFESDPRTGQQILTRPDEWDEVHLHSDGLAADLTAIRADGSFVADPLLTAIREWVALN